MADDDLEALPLWRPPTARSVSDWERLKRLPVPGEEVVCLLCGRKFEMRMYIGIPDQSCPECFKSLRECAKLHCAKCGLLVAKLAPKKLDCGFEIKPGMSLRVDACSSCVPDIKESKVLEITKWKAQRGKVVAAASAPGKPSIWQV
jgi:hypothetical protein